MTSRFAGRALANGLCALLLLGAAENLTASSAAAEPELPDLQVSGDAAGLRAGPGSLTVRVSNNGDQPQVVRYASARVVRAACPTSTLTAQPWRGHVVVPAGGTASVALPVEVRVEACAAPSWSLHYEAHG